MLDPARLRADPQAAASALATRGCKFDADAFGQIDERARSLQQQVEKLRAQRNADAREIAQAVAAGDEKQAEQRKKQAAQSGSELDEAEAQLREARQGLRDFLLGLPNLPDDAVPAGSDESANIVLDVCGKPRDFSFKALDHVALGEKLDGMDFAVAGKMAQARFVVLSGAVAHLHRALAQFMLELHVNEHGYIEHYIPYLVNSQALVNSGQLPKFADAVFRAADDDLSLIPTAEGPLVNLAAGCLFSPEQLPLKAVAHTPSFRREAGSHGRDTRGMLRQHQFDKVELVQIVHPDDSQAALVQIIGHAARVLELLELPYRKVQLCTGDMSEAAAQTVDLEVWMPGQQLYREISSCSNCTDYQARRMQARVRNAPGKGKALVHTLNGSGLAVGRALIAVLENHQQQDGSIAIPAALRPYLGGKSSIS